MSRAIFSLKELGEFKNGANYPKGSYGLGDKIVNVKDLFKGRYIRFDNLDELKSSALKDKTIYLVEDGDLLFTRSSLVKSGAGMVALVKKPKEDVLFCGFIIRYRLFKTNVNPLYLLYLLRSPNYRKLFTDGAVQTNISNINQQTLGEIEVELPEFEEQNKTVAILDYIDTKIELNTKINYELELIGKTLYDYWFIQYNFPNSKGKPYKSSGGKMVWNEEIKREIPEGWKVKMIMSIANFINGKGIKKEFINKDGKYSVFGSSGIVGKTNQILFSEPVIAIGRVGANYGEVHYSLEPCWISDNAVTAQPLENFYLWWLIDTLKRINYKQIAGGSAQPLITQGQLKELKFALPNDELFKQFHEKVQSLYIHFNQNLKQNQKLSELRNWLLPMLMNGQVKVGAAEDKAELRMAAEPRVKYGK